MGGAWNWEDNTEYRDGRLYGKPGSRIIRIFMDDGTGLWSPFVKKKGIAGSYGKLLADPKSGTARTRMFPRGYLLSEILKSLSSGGLDRLNAAEVIDGVNDLDWLERIRNEPNRKEIMERAKRIAYDDADLERLGNLIGNYFEHGNAGFKGPANFFNAGVGASLGPRSLVRTVAGGHEGLSGLIVPSRKESLWGPGDRDISFLYGGGDYFDSPSEIFNSIYERDSGGKYRTARALFDAIILDNFFHSKAYEDLDERGKRYFDDIEDYDDLVDAVNSFDLRGVGKIKGDALRQFILGSLRDIPVTYAFDPNPSGSDIDERLVNNAMVDKLVEALANVGYDTMLTAETRGKNPKNLVAGVVSIDGERVIDNAMRSAGSEDVRADTPAEGLVSGVTPLFSKSTVHDMLDNNIPMYVSYRKKGADSGDAWADKGSLGDILGDLDNIDSDERLKVVRDTAARIRDYADRLNICSALTRGPGND